ncbi:hypothetical protein EMPG_15766 [Blastomyces silverae]|uniref:Uncharacterized protein n=1 Tax=Blastomyces silverae TaxID=2060906 RepID=A0A0H1BCJ1_9EURO|nr:hypothetical protein EMPG_15766 [Blastomyces silverae]
MAPRRGGGGSFGGGSSASCSSYAFSIVTSKIDLVYFVAYLIIDSVLLWLAKRKLFGSKDGGKPPGRRYLMVSITVMVLAHTWGLVFLVLGQCDITNIPLSAKLSLVGVFLSVIATSSLVGALMISICKRLLQVANMSPRIIAILHILLSGGFAVFYFIATCIFIPLITEQFGYSSTNTESLVMAWNGVMTLAGVLLVVGMLSTAYTLMATMSRGASLKASRLRRYAPFLAVSCVGFGATFLAQQILTYSFAWKPSVSVTRGSLHALGFIFMFCYSSSFWFAVLFAASPALTNNERRSVAEEPFQQQQPTYEYPVQPNALGPNVPLMQQYPQQSYPQQSYPSVPPAQPYHANQQPYDPHHPKPPAAY